jgi:hypothetical protein
VSCINAGSFGCVYYSVGPMHSMHSMRGGFIFFNQGPSLKSEGMCSMCSVRGGFIFSNHITLMITASMSKHAAGEEPPGAARNSAKPLHDKTQGSASRWRSQLSPA